MRHAVVSLVKLVQVGVLAGCTYPPLPHVVVPREVEQFSVTPSRALDLLFLIDDSPSMADKQANLASSFPNFSPKADHLRLTIEGQAMLPADAYVTASCALVPAS